ncbi:MAG TPA: SIS domain-containing protein [Propionicimonas sp.]|jgi:uncharacterized phosphosugar-binding protein
MNDPATFKRYIGQVEAQLHHVAANSERICEAADAIAEAMLHGRPLFVFGASHAGLMAQDLFYRAGGLVPIVPILPAGLMLNERPVQRTSRLERLPGVAETFMADVPIQDGDVVVVISVSGRNPVPLEVCELAQQRGATVIAVTAVAFSASQPSRGRRRLFEIADLVLDLPVATGDAVLTLAHDLRVGPTSSAVGIAMLHGLVCEVASRLAEAGMTPPVYVSGNIDGADERNDRLIDEYRERIGYAG